MLSINLYLHILSIIKVIIVGYYNFSGIIGYKVIRKI